jgi:uncharacterized protein (TIGR03435 family)
MTGLVGDHLWQSTIVAIGVALVTFMLRNNRAQVRYALWLAASLKFVVPFAMLVALGSQIGWRSSTEIRRREVAFVIDAVGQPFSRAPLRIIEAPVSPRPPSSGMLPAALPVLAAVVWGLGAAFLLSLWTVRWRRITAIVRRATVVGDGRVYDALRELEGPGHPRPRVYARGLEIVSADTSLEPGVFGIRHPVLLWPRTLEAHLSDSQIEAILAHELAHVRRRDNLAALGHMVVQAVFWFHPLVWWIGSRLVDERERACDDEVLRSGSDREVYAESVLKTCRFHVQSPLVCVSGVTGSDLKKRIESIMRGHGGVDLSAWKKLLLGTAAIATIAIPIVIGGLHAPRVRAQVPSIDELPAFEVASVKPNTSGEMRAGMMNQPGGRLTVTNNTVQNIIRNAYQLQDLQIVGGPDWLASERFDIVAKAPLDVPPRPIGTVGPMQLMLRRLLAERFQLGVHRETRELPIFALVVARSDGRLGAGLQQAAVDCAAVAAARGRGAPLPPPPGPGDKIQCGMRFLPGHVSGGGFSMTQFAGSLSPLVQRMVIDRTKLPGSFDIELTWTPDNMGRGATPPPGAPPFPPIDPSGPSIFTALQEQLGLKLDAERGPVEVLVIDRVERPTPD